MTHTDMEHPTMPGRVIRVHRQAVPHREAAGWRLAPTDPAGEPADDTAAGDTAVDTEQAGTPPAEEPEGGRS